MRRCPSVSRPSVFSPAIWRREPAYESGAIPHGRTDGQFA